MTFSAGGAVLNTKGEILVVSQRGDSWSLPKGHIDEGETALEAAKREIYEESGISDLELVGDLGTYERYRIGNNGIGEDTSELKSITIFLFRTGQTDLRPLDPDNPEARWVSLDEAITMLTHPKDREFFRGILDKLQDPNSKNQTSSN